jgi:UDP-2,3-diacylglucosamine hydrolase
VAALFISDLHLDQARPAITRLFLGFLEERAGEAEALYILGDLFEVWIGDDDDEALGREVAAGLKRLAARTPIYLMHGNRDFLLGEGFEADSGVRLLPETEVIDLYGQPTLIMHGDTLCTDDVEYQAFRARVRSPQWLSQVLGLPLVQRRMMAKKLRADSQKAIQDKAAAITDVNQQTVMEVMREHGVRQLIHGHTHRPGIHEFPLDDKPARRVVLGDWYARGSVLYCDAAGCRLEALG